MISSDIGLEENGKTSFAVPGSNLLVALVRLFLMMFALPTTVGETVFGLYAFSAYNVAFNTIPVWSLDGAKMLRWSKLLYIATLLTASLMLFVVSC